MSNYIFTIRFEDDSNSLSAESGLSIEKLGELLMSLSKAIGLKEEPLTLSRIKGNCYAFELCTSKRPVYDTLKSVHDRISNNDFAALNNDQIKYAAKLNMILSDKYRMNVYDPNKTFNLKIQNTVIPKRVECYYEVDDVYGIIASIGGRSIESHPCIKLSSLNYEIFVTCVQESKLLKYFKKDRILFRLNKKIDFETGRVISAELLNYEVIKTSAGRFVDNVEELLLKRKGKALFPKVKDSVISVRELRGNMDINILDDEHNSKEHL